MASAAVKAADSSLNLICTEVVLPLQEAQPFPALAASWIFRLQLAGTLRLSKSANRH